MTVPEARGPFLQFVESVPMWARMVTLSGSLLGAGMVIQREFTLIQKAPAQIERLQTEVAEAVARCEGQVAEVRRETALTRINAQRLTAVEDALCAPQSIQEGGVDRDRRCYAIMRARPQTP